MNDWNIQSRAHTCQGCGKHFADQQTYHTLLSDFKHDIARLDLCEACWKAEHSEGARDRKGFISHWQGVYEAPAATPEAIQKENAESLLRRLIELNDPKYAAASYILAVMLERKRMLKIKEQLQRESVRIFVYEQPKTGDLFTIPDPNLQLNQLEEVQRIVASLLEHGLNPPASPDCGTAPGASTAAQDTDAGIQEGTAPEDEPAPSRDCGIAENETVAR